VLTKSNRVWIYARAETPVGEREESLRREARRCADAMASPIVVGDGLRWVRRIRRGVGGIITKGSSGSGITNGARGALLSRAAAAAAAAAASEAAVAATVLRRRERRVGLSDMLLL